MDESTLQLRHPDSLGQAFLWALLPTLALVLIAPSLGDAQVQVTTSITSTPGAGNLATTITHAGDLYNITGGTRPGNGPNLFHSFGDFSVGGGDIGNFLNNTGLPTSNILGRVTGGHISNIDGTIQTTGFGNANVFLVNPSGIVLGPHGSVNVGGSVSFTTAQYLRLFDGVNSANFYSNPANDGLANSVLAVAPVVDFGFLSPAAYGFLTPPDPSATITVQGSALSVPSGQSISLVGGKVVIQGATLPDGTVQPAHLSAPNGSIQLASTASPGEFDVATLQPLPNVDGASFTSLGSVSLALGSSINVSGPRTVFVKGGQLVLSVNDAILNTSESPAPQDTISLSSGSSILMSNSGAEPGADAQITVGTLQMEGASIQSTTTGDGSGGNITADVGTLALTNGAMISSNSLFGLGQGGNVTVQGLQGSGSPAASVSLDNSRIGTEINGGSAANTPATITITAQTLALANDAAIAASTVGAAPAGDIALNVGTLTVGNSTISTSSSSTDATAGNAGNITIQGITGSGSPAADVRLDNSIVSTEINGGSAASTPGTITITAQTLALANDAAIGADTFGTAPAGDITLNVDTLTVANSGILPPPGFPPEKGGVFEGGVVRFFGITSSSGVFELDQLGQPILQDATAGDAGSITIQGITGSGSPAATVSLLDNSNISTQIFGGSAANTPATITITAQTLALLNPRFIEKTFSNTHIGADTVGAAPAGNIALNVGMLTAGSGSNITSNSSFLGIDFPLGSAGNAGSITIQGITGSGSPAATVSLDGGTIRTEITGGSAATTPGAITITAQTLALVNGAAIGADTGGAAPAGDITLNVDTLTVSNSLGFGLSGITSSSTFSDSTAGNAGSITIQGITGSGSPAAAVSLDSRIVSTTIVGGSSSTTPATIDITAQTVNLANGAQISADTGGAAPAGDITLNVDTLTVSNSLGFGFSGITSSSTFSDSTAGNAGNITIQGVTGSGSPAADVSLDSSIVSTTIAGGTSSSIPAAIEVTAQTVNFANGSQIKADTSGAAPAGNIAVNVDTLTAGNSTISSSSSPAFIDVLQVFSEGGGNAGNITIQGVTGSGSPATSVSLDASDISTTIAGGTSSTTPATIDITAQTVNLENGARIKADTTGLSPAGNIILNASTLTAVGDSEISSGSFVDVSLPDLAAGNAGNITIQGISGTDSPAANVSLDRSEISTRSFGIGGTAANIPGTITITARTLTLSDSARIRADSATSGGPAGNITLNVGTLTAANSRIDGSTDGFAFHPEGGKAGNVTIQGISGSDSPAAEVNLDGSSITTLLIGATSTATTAIPSDITITAHTLAMANGASISASTFGNLPAGNITLNVGTLTGNSSSIVTESNGLSAGSTGGGNAGNITIQGITGAGSPVANVSLDNSKISTQIFEGIAANTAANIDITARTLVLTNEASIRADTAGAAPAGNITLKVGTLTAVGHSAIASRSFPSFESPSTEEGKAGSITIHGVNGPASSATSVSLDLSTFSTTIAGGTSSTTPATIDITAQTVNLANGAQISADTTGAAPAGDITLNVDMLTATNDSTISNSSSSTDSSAGKAGGITIQGLTGSGSPATELNLDHSTISTRIAGGSETTTAASIDIIAQTVKISGNFEGIDAGTTGKAQAGDISIKAATVEIAKGSFIGTDSGGIGIESSGGGRAGNIFIQATDNLLYGMESPSLFNTMITTSNHGSGVAGTITINTPNLVISNFAQINSVTVGTGSGGSIELNVGKQLTITSGGSINSATNDERSGAGGPVISPTPAGTGGTISITSPLVILEDRAALNSATEGSGQAGNIRLNVGELRADTSTIRSSSLTSDAGNAGHITIQGVTGSSSPAADVSIDNSIIDTSVAGGTPSSVPANISISAHAVTLSNGGSITASTTGNAPAGDIEIVTQQLKMAPDSAISSNTDGTGKAGSIIITGAGSAPTMIAGGTIQAQSETIAVAGNITLQAPGDLTLLGTTVSVKNTGPGSAGSINLHGGNDLLMRNTKVSTESAEASGGNIKLTAPNLVRLVDSTLTSSVKGEAGSSNGGNITIDPQFVVIQNSQLLATANAGAGGNITISALGAVVIDPNSLLSASAGPAGVSGSVNIIAPFQVLGGILVPLNQSFSQASLSGDRCAADPTGQFSSFIQTGRDGVPQVPGALSPSPLSFLETLTSGSLGSPGPNWAATRFGLDSISFGDSTRFHSACRS